MATLLEYIGPISLAVALVLYGIYSFFKKTSSPSATSSQKPDCPNCHSTKIVRYQPKKIAYSRKAAAIGHALAGRNGSLFAMLYEADRSYWRCRFCGHHFSRKENRYIRQ